MERSGERGATGSASGRSSCQDRRCRGGGAGCPGRWVAPRLRACVREWTLGVIGIRRVAWCWEAGVYVLVLVLE